jgi:DNA-directed RNA polymerase I, II, and III subunit RPABC1
METILQSMLKARGVEGVPSDVEGLEGKLQKYGSILVWNSMKKAVTSGEMDAFLEKLAETGAAQGILIIKAPPSPKTLERVRKEAARLQVFCEDNLKFDISKHRKVPPHRILNAEEREALLKRYNIQTPESQMPLLDSQDPMAKWIGARPGDIVEILRRSETAGSTPYYRCCVADVSHS